MFQPIWKVDCNEPNYRKDSDGKKIPYATPPGPSELIGTPVLYEGKVYCAIGQDPEHGDGVGRLSCIDAKTGFGLKFLASLRYPNAARDSLG